MHLHEVATIGAMGAVCLFFLVLVAYAIYGIVICFAEDSTLNNFKNFSISNMVLIVMGLAAFMISAIGLIIVIRKGGFSKCGNGMDSDAASIADSVINA